MLVFLVDGAGRHVIGIMIAESRIHSATDDQWPVVSQPGFVSIVFPRFALDPIKLEETWAGILQADGRWIEAPLSCLLEVTA